MAESIKRIVIVGGGTAGWLTAGLIAAEHTSADGSGVNITLIESPDVKPIGVGEGTWPTMRTTLRKMGIAETDFIRGCDASFKQGTKFCGWVTGQEDDSYYHPFTLPRGFPQTNLAIHWQAHKDRVAFADAACFQGALCDKGLAPKQITTPEYAAVANYAYHLDAGKVAQFLQKHCTTALGVEHVLDHVVQVNSDPGGDITSLNCKKRGDIAAELFIDCSGFASLLLGQHYEIPFISRHDSLFVDSALAVQVPYAEEDSPIASCTISTAQQAGWVWDIGLPSRRGVGYVYSSAHSTDESAEQQLRAYLKPSLGAAAESASLRKISFNSGHRREFWHRNCVAVGLSAGFLEPLEASALVLVELSADMISEQLPANRATMDIVAKRFNEKFLYRWDRAIDFLKLHYVLNRRTDSDFWQDNRRDASIPDSLSELLTLWRHHFPSNADFTQVDEIFPAASYQYVLYGMGFETEAKGTARQTQNTDHVNKLFRENADKAAKLVAALPTNRELIAKVRQYGFSKV